MKEAIILFFLLVAAIVIPNMLLGPGADVVKDDMGALPYEAGYLDTEVVISGWNNNICIGESCWGDE